MLLSAWLSAVLGLYGAKQASLALPVGYVFVPAAPIAVRRRWPSVTAVVVSVAYFLAVTLRIPEIYAGNIAMFIALYTVGAWEQNRRRATIVRIAIIVGMFNSTWGQFPAAVSWQATDQQIRQDVIESASGTVDPALGPAG